MQLSKEVSGNELEVLLVLGFSILKIVIKLVTQVNRSVSQ